jgi:hypothetical protein
MSDFSIYKQLETARVGSNTDISNAASVVAQSHQRVEKFQFANLSASSAEGVNGSGRVPFAAQLKSAYVTANLAAVANATDYSTVNLFKRTGAGAAVLMATANLSNVTVAKLVPIALTLVSNASNTTFAAGDVFTANVALTGNGTANNVLAVVDVIYEDV